MARDSKARAYALDDRCTQGGKQLKATVAGEEACFMWHSPSSGVQCHRRSGGTSHVLCIRRRCPGGTKEQVGASESLEMNGPQPPDSLL